MSARTGRMAILRGMEYVLTPTAAILSETLTRLGLCGPRTLRGAPGPYERAGDVRGPSGGRAALLPRHHAENLGHNLRHRRPSALRERVGGHSRRPPGRPGGPQR